MYHPSDIFPKECRIYDIFSDHSMGRIGRGWYNASIRSTIRMEAKPLCPSSR